MNDETIGIVTSQSLKIINLMQQTFLRCCLKVLGHVMRRSGIIPSYYAAVQSGWRSYQGEIGAGGRSKQGFQRFRGVAS